MSTLLATWHSQSLGFYIQPCSPAPDGAGPRGRGHCGFVASTSPGTGATGEAATEKVDFTALALLPWCLEGIAGAGWEVRHVLLQSRCKFYFCLELPVPVLELETLLKGHEEALALTLDLLRGRAS